jgi:hypothetical protein
MSTDESPPPSDHPPVRQFNLRMAFLLTTVVAISAAVWGGLTRDSSDRLLFVCFAAAAPFGLLVILGLWQEVSRLRRKR